MKSVIVLIFACTGMSFLLTILSLNKKTIAQNIYLAKSGGQNFQILAQGVPEARQNNKLIIQQIASYIEARESMNILSNGNVNKIDLANYMRIGTWNNEVVHKDFRQSILENYKNAKGRNRNTKVIKYKSLTNDQRTLEYEVNTVFTSQNDLYDALIKQEETKAFIIIKYHFDDAKVSIDENRANLLGIVINYYDFGELKK